MKNNQSAFMLLRRLLFLLHATIATAAAAAIGGGSVRCDRQCGSTTVPYPFGFSAGGDCPITLTCNATASTPLLLPHSRRPAASSSSPPSYPILSFNATASTFLISLPPSCNRTVSEARSALNGSRYGVTNHTALFLGGGGCRSHGAANCSVRADIMTTLLSLLRLRTAGCGAGIGNDTSWTCVAEAELPAAANRSSAPPDSASRGGGGHGQSHRFLEWNRVDEAGCDHALTATVYGEATEGVPALEFSVVELGWWLDGKCSGAGAGSCAQNAWCEDVETPSGSWGHLCRCPDGMSGDGYAAGDGCHYDVAEHSKKKIFLIAAGVVAGVAAAAGLLLLLCRLHHRRRHKAGRSASSRLAAMRLLSEAATSSGVPVYSYAEIARATDSFSPTHRLGNGAYGTVYIGKLPGSSPTLVAIKRLRCRLHHDADDAAAEAAVLLNEIKLISSVSHPNLVRLLGFSLDGGEQILIYEFVPNGTLSHHLLSGAATGGGRRRLTWRERLVVAAETAAAIAYLHGIRPLPIFHRDVKSSNILLDASLRPKLADFGLSRAVDRLEAARSHVSTAPQGTPGYVDPEYHQNFHLSDKSDVYSFGVVLLELITAMKVVDFDRPADEVNLASLGLDRIGKGRVNEIVDPAILGDGEEEWVMGSVRLVSELAFRCLAFQKDVRPAMSEVAAELHRIRCAAPDGDGDGDDSEEHGARLRHGNMTDVQIDVSLDGSDAMAKKKKKKAAASPVSVQEVWVSDHSSPSTNGSMPRFAA